MTKKAQVKKSTGRRSIKRSKRQVKQRRSTRRSSKRGSVTLRTLQTRSRASRRRSVRGGGTLGNVTGVATVATGAATAWQIKNTRRQAIQTAIHEFKETCRYWNNDGSYKKIQSIYKQYQYPDKQNASVPANFSATLLSFCTEHDDPKNEFNTTLENELMSVNLKDPAKIFLDKLKDVQTPEELIIALLALYIRDCSFASALYLLLLKQQKKTDMYNAQCEDILKLEIVPLYISTLRTSQDETTHKTLFVTDYTRINASQATESVALGDNDTSTWEREQNNGEYYFDAIRNVDIDSSGYIERLKCFITPGYYDDYLGHKGNTLRYLGHKGNTLQSGAPVTAYSNTD